MCIDIVKISFGNLRMLVAKFSSMFDRVTCPVYDSGGVLSYCLLILIRSLDDAI